MLFFTQVFATGFSIPVVGFGDKGLWGMVVSKGAGDRLLYKGEVLPVDFEAFALGSSYDSKQFWVNLHPFLLPSQCLSPILQSNDVGWVFMEADLWLKRDLRRAIERFGVLFDRDLLHKGALLRAWIEPGRVVVLKSKDGFVIKKAELKVNVKSVDGLSTKISQIPVLERWLTDLVNHSKRYAFLRRVFRAHLLGKLTKADLPVRVDVSVFRWDGRLYQRSYISLFSQQVYKEGLSWVIGGATFKGSAPEIVRVPTTDFYRLGLNTEMIEQLLKDYFPNLLTPQGTINEENLKKEALELLKYPPHQGLSEEERLKLVILCRSLGGMR